MNFVAIDFETATSQRNSPCEIGLTFIEDWKIKETKSWLIKPESNYYDSYNIRIHGITPDDTKDKPEFGDLWSEIRPYVENKFLIAHNAGFDFSVLRKSLELYDLDFPELSYSCSYIFSKKVWPGLPGYGLRDLCTFNQIQFSHHRAGDDSLAAAKLSLKAFAEIGLESLEQFTDKLQVNIGRLFPGGYKPSETKRVYYPKETKQYTGDPEKHNPDSIFYGRNVLFTGKMDSMTRDEANQAIADIGGTPMKGFNNSIEFLVVGQQDYRVVGDDGMSSKQEKTIKLIEKGKSIEIMSEDDFLRNL
ncbi:exonuclease domain-containing protein [Algoriphagus halophytocola]|uniref:exonuclease domain-containing protein n=1 Tax=Algoriphagus halophytocola TaxID=2991499 RepID=UPI0022DD6612|nr:exonuclease domain-containing protein [Algoriphagus sp. TR-M9]WBL42408.1 exonuclease domain-containing protein [Algoriphagus sp. TR-M9]WBL43081.1 exonuclease domain-containing protein [Algoriphagus sp. TR-M9]